MSSRVCGMLSIIFVYDSEWIFMISKTKYHFESLVTVGDNDKVTVVKPEQSTK